MALWVNFFSSLFLVQFMDLDYPHYVKLGKIMNTESPCMIVSWVLSGTLLNDDFAVALEVNTLSLGNCSSNIMTRYPALGI